MGKVNLTIDGIKVKTEAGVTVLDAARREGIYIPTLCARPDIPGSIEYCRLCVVEAKGAGSRFPSACVTPVAEGMVIQTGTPRVQELRRHFLKAILSPVPPPRLKRVQLQKLAEYIGVKEEDIPAYVSRDLPVDRDQPLFDLDHNRCILCGLCIRMCKEVQGKEVFDFVSRNGRFMIQPFPASSPRENGCRFCGVCVEVCPTGAIMDKEGPGPGYEAGLAPCAATCPAGIDVPRYVRLVGERRFAEAAAVVRETVPFPGVLGRVCFHPCEAKCRRGQLDEPIAISALKRVAAERDARTWRFKLKAVAPTGKKVAVVGSGPAGLTAGYYLARRGHAVTVFEALSEAGGMLRAGIPDYRLPREVLDADIAEIKRVGVDIKTSTRIRSLDSLLKQGYDAVLLDVGTQRSLKLGVDGEDSPGVMEGISFLRDVNSGKKVRVKGRVGVIGGGNVAIDAARTSLRLGAGEVVLICLEKREEMPAHEWAIQRAVDEGVVLNGSWGIKKIRNNGKRVTGVDCIRCTSVFDKKGKFSPSFNEAVKTSFDLDTVIVAIGQAPDLSCLGKTDKVQVTKGGTVKVGADLVTDMAGVFASGDAVTGPTSVIEAIAAGRKSAIAIDKYLRGSGDISEPLVDAEATELCLGPGEGFADLCRVQMPCLPVASRMAPAAAGHFAEIEMGLTEDMALTEARRCLQCQVRFQVQPILPPPAK